jgi:oxygen-dependent protoporphyrinogen oxidase
LHALEQRYGSLILGQILGARERKKRGTVSKQNAPKFSFANGLEHLPNSLGRHLAEELRLQHSFCGIEQTRGGWKLTFETPARMATVEHETVLLAAPAYKLAGIDFSAAGATDLGFLRDIRYAPVSALVLGFRREQIEHPLDGFGFLVPGIERLSILGTVFSSSLFPDRAPAGHVLLTCYVGGMRAPALAFEEIDPLLSLVLRDLKTLLGVKERPVFMHRAAHAKGIPQYELGYGRIHTQILEIEKRFPGLFFAGNWRGGISVGDAIHSGIQMAERIQPIARGLNSSAAFIPDEIAA